MCTFQHAFPDPAFPFSLWPVLRRWVKRSWSWSIVSTCASQRGGANFSTFCDAILSGTQQDSSSSANAWASSEWVTIWIWSPSKKFVIQKFFTGNVSRGELLWIWSFKYRNFLKYPNWALISFSRRTVFHTETVCSKLYKGTRLEEMYVWKREHDFSQFLLYQNSDGLRKKFKSMRPSESWIQASHPCSSTSELMINFRKCLTKLHHSFYTLISVRRLTLYHSIPLRYSSLNITVFLLSLSDRFSDVLGSWFNFAIHSITWYLLALRWHVACHHATIITRYLSSSVHEFNLG